MNWFEGSTSAEFELCENKKHSRLNLMDEVDPQVINLRKSITVKIITNIMVKLIKEV
jgi:hypothetical protein